MAGATARVRLPFRWSNIRDGANGNFSPHCASCTPTVVDEGYGLAYSVNSNNIRFNITSMNRDPHHNVLAFRDYLAETCGDVREMMEKGGAVAPPAGDAKPKL